MTKLTILKSIFQNKLNSLSLSNLEGGRMPRTDRFKLQKFDN